MAGYHIQDIEVGTYGEPSKIFEEIDEFADALDQGAKLMGLMELSDAIGAIDGYLTKHFPGLTIADLIKMSEITRRVFETGHRSPKE